MRRPHVPARWRPAADRCREGADELRSGIREWQARWVTVIDGTTEGVESQIGEAAAALVEAAAAGAELGLGAIRLGELEAEAEPLVEEIEERAGAWTAPSLEEIREEVLTEERRLAGQISDRVEEVLESHDFQTGAIETLQNELDLAHSDLDNLTRETSRVRQSLLPGLSQILSETDRASREAAESAARADEAVTTARGCLERIRSRVGDAEAPLKEVPYLLGKSDSFAIAYLEESDLRPLLLTESTLDDMDVGKVANQDPAAGAKLPSGGTVTLWVYTADVKPPPRTTVPDLTQGSCDVKWPGTMLVTQGGGSSRCECPSGSAWSSVQNSCLSLVAESSDPAVGGRRDCSNRPGTIFDPRTGECECFAGTWVAAEGRCVDPRVAERQEEIDSAQTRADCEHVLSNVRTFRNHPSSVHRQMASSAEAKARTLGCDDSAIQEAIQAGDRQVWVTPPTGGGRDAATVGPTLHPEVPLDNEIFRPPGRPTAPPPSGERDDRQSSGDCTPCNVYSDWFKANSGPCGYHPLRLPSICELDSECVYWAEQCARYQRLLNECMANCSR